MRMTARPGLADISLQLPPVPRYLVPFHPKQTAHRFTDVLVIGAGVAGMRAALAIEPSQSVLMVSKSALRQSNSFYAQGGIAGVLDPSDSFQDHVQDTLAAGGALCDRTVVEQVVKEAPERILELAAWGADFDLEQGHLALGREGGHSKDRIVHALGDATGQEIVRVMTEQVAARPNIVTWEQTFTLDLLTHEGVCKGALLWQPDRGPLLVWAKQTILSTGGCGQIYRETTNPQVATGDGHAMAIRAGAEVRDMEFIQFHPTVLYIAGSSRCLITEAMRGAGAHLVDRAGHRFMPDYDPRAELAPRDVVSRSIVEQMDKTRHPNVYLDLSHLVGDFVRKRFPGMAKVCAEFGLDITRDRIPVRPGAHYMIGGLTIDSAGQTSLPGLWAAGEVSSSGLHGANRLASNSLLEGLVHGRNAGLAASEKSSGMPDSFRAEPICNAGNAAAAEDVDLNDISNALKSLMGRACGVMRHQSGLLEAKEAIEQWCKYMLPRQFQSPAGWQLQNMLLVARVMVAAALAREETRGVHSRTDFPESVDTLWCRHIKLCGKK